jgi:DNA topoisomerase-3
MGLDNLWKPDLRGRIEQGIARIAAGLVTKDTVRGSSMWYFKLRVASSQVIITAVSVHT